MKRVLISVLLAVVLSFLCLAIIDRTHEADDALVTTKSGRVAGSRNAEVVSWKGLPYAAPPLGPRRWEAPDPPVAWRGIRDGGRFGPICAQAGSTADTSAGSEDCLTLNIWRPREMERGLPVLLFIHGGSFVRGGSPPYDGGWLSAHGRIVVITMNYRLGPFGYLAHPALGDDSGNFGLLDQIQALRWIHENISQFGGDPDHVLIVGQSAGASSVAALVSSPRTIGLISAAVIESGALTARNPEAAEEDGRSFASEAGCSEADPFPCLRGKTAELLISTDRRRDPTHFMWRPVSGTSPLPRTPLAVMRGNEWRTLPLIIGTTSDEFMTLLRLVLKKPVVSLEDYDVAVLDRLHVRKEEIESLHRLYPAENYMSSASVLAVTLRDAHFRCPARALSAGAATSESAPVWRFLYTHKFDHGKLAPFGAGHGFELHLLFHNMDDFSADEETLSGEMIRYWSRFAATGDPNGGSDRDWPKYGAKHEFLRLDTPISISADIEDAPCNFWNSRRIQGLEGR